MRTNVFTSFLLLFCAPSSALIPPPTFVTVECQNVKVLVSWNYPDQHPQTIFMVTLQFEDRTSEGRTRKDCKMNTTAHQVELSECIWNSDEEYINYNYVHVTAVLGGNQSAGVLANSFSFNSLQTVDTKCSLDFPPVDVYQEGSSVGVRFQNPLIFYKKQFLTRKDDSRTRLRVIVSPVKNGSKLAEEFECFCTQTEDICECDVDFLEGAAACVAVIGELFFREGNKQVKFKQTKACPLDSIGTAGGVLAAIVSSVAALLIIVPVAIICLARAWTLTSPPLPNALQHVDAASPLGYGALPCREDATIAAVQSVKRSVHSESSHDDPPHPPSAQLFCESNSEDDSSHLSGKTDCTSAESEEENGSSQSHYDCPHMCLDLGDGDHVEVYTDN